MYNRYIPQPDGSYRRSQMPDTPQNSTGTSSQPEEPRHQAPPRQERPPQAEPEHREETANPQRQPSSHMRSPHQNRQSSPPPRQRKPSQQQPERKDLGVGNFLRQLLPKDFDTEDLLIVLLLLLMSGDCAEDQNFALLTLALYLFM